MAEESRQQLGQLPILARHEEADIGGDTKVLKVTDGWIYWKTMVRRMETGRPEGPTERISCAITGVFVPETR